MSKDLSTSILIHEGHLSRLHDVELQLVCLRSLMEQTGPHGEDRYSAVLGLIDPIIHQLQQAIGRIWECKRQPRATVSELRPVPDETPVAKGEGD